jgi:hypothetical protein
MLVKPRSMNPGEHQHDHKTGKQHSSGRSIPFHVASPSGGPRNDLAVVVTATVALPGFVPLTETIAGEIVQLAPLGVPL